jgi:hypothetical protein
MSTIKNTPRDKFVERILKNSKCRLYKNAVDEWEVILIFSVPNDVEIYCICGQPIIKSCLIKNKVTNKVLLIGVNCKEKYIKHIHNVSYSALNHLYKNNVVSQWEYTFLESIADRKTHSPKQKDVCARVVQKIIKYYMELEPVPEPPKVSTRVRTLIKKKDSDNPTTNEKY